MSDVNQIDSKERVRNLIEESLKSRGRALDALWMSGFDESIKKLNKEDFRKFFMDLGSFDHSKMNWRRTR